MIATSRVSGANFATAVADSGASWGTITNALVEDGSTAFDGNIGPGGGTQTVTELLLTGFGFAIPSIAIIDGIKLEAKTMGTGGMHDNVIYLKGTFGTTGSSANTPDFGRFWGTSLNWISWGGPNSLWGRSWTPAEINSSTFGAGLSGFPNTGSQTSYIDAVKITVFWHYDTTVAPAEVPLRYDHKIYSPSGQYVGNLPNVVSEFETTQDINTAGSQLGLDVASNDGDKAQPSFAPGRLLSWLAGAWNYRTKLTIQKNKMTAGIVTDFPTFVDLSTFGSHFWLNVKSDGSDIRITDAYGSVELPFELIAFNQSTKTGQIWFKAPLLTPDYDNFFYFYYGNAGASAYASTAQFGSQNVWVNGYKAVYHLEEGQTTTASAYKDSTASAAHGSGTSMSASAATHNKVGKAINLDGVDDTITVSNVFGLGTSNITLSAWAYIDSFSETGTFLKVGTSQGYGIGIGGTTFGDTGTQFIMLFEGVRWITTGVFLSQPGYHFVQMVINGSGTPLAYVDGALVGTFAGSGALAANTTTFIGSDNGGAPARYFAGELDEIRIVAAARNAAWISAEYANQNSPSTFYSVSTQYETLTQLGYTPLLRNGNLINVYESSYYYPNGKLLYQGQINRIQANFDPQVNSIVKVICHSDGRDLDNLVTRGSPFTYTTDQSQTTQNSRVSNSTSIGWQRQGQTWTTGAAVTNIGLIQLMLDGTANVTVKVYTSPGQATLIGSVTKFVSVGGPTVVDFAFSDMIVVTPSTQYFFEVLVNGGESIWVHYNTGNPYANGAKYDSSYAGGSGGGAYGIDSGNDLYFTTSSGTPSTQATFTSKDPTTQILKPIIDDYRSRGGIINYDDNLATIDATGLSLTINFNTNTIFEAIKKISDMSPATFYYYVDLGTNKLWFKDASRTADFILVKGRHVGSLELVFSIENVINDYLFSGGPAPTANLYAEYSDTTSKGMYGNRLDRKSDNRVTVQATADAIGVSHINQLKDEQQHTAVVVYARTMDITLFKPGKMIGFRGYGNFIDNLLLQVTKVQYNGRQVTLQIGTAPLRFDTSIEQVLRGLLQEQTFNNPATPA